MSVKHTLINFFIREPEEILEAMAELANSKDGKSWMNLLQWVGNEDLPTTTPLVKLFSARGPDIPMASWVPTIDGKKFKPASLGISHAAGRFADRQLKELGINTPEGWILKQDHPRRGLVYELSLLEDVIPKEDDTAIRELLNFMVAASKALTKVPITDKWVADILKQK